MARAQQHQTTATFVLTDDRIGLRPLAVTDAEAYLTPAQVNLSYALYPQWRGQGYATRALRLAIRAARTRCHVDEFVIRAAPDNPESIAAAERAGFERAGQTNDAHGELIWLTRQAQASSRTTARA